MLPKIIKLINNTKAIFKIDSEPTKGSNNLVTSGGVYGALKSNCGSAVIVLKDDWASQVFPTELENVTDSPLPKLQHFNGNYTEYKSQLPLLYVIISGNSGENVYTCKLKRVLNPEYGEQFTWLPYEEAPFTAIEARYNSNNFSWIWTIDSD